MSQTSRLVEVIQAIGADIKLRPKVLILGPADPLPNPLPSDGTLIVRRNT